MGISYMQNGDYLVPKLTFYRRIFSLLVSYNTTTANIVLTNERTAWYHMIPHEGGWYMGAF